MARHSFHYGRARRPAPRSEKEAEADGPDRDSDAQCAIAVRLAGPGDTAELERLSILGSKPLPRAPLLVAEVDGRIVAALAPWMWRERLVDPCSPTAESLALLERHAAQLRASSRRRRGSWGIARFAAAKR